MATAREGGAGSGSASLDGALDGESHGDRDVPASAQLCDGVPLVTVSRAELRLWPGNHEAPSIPASTTSLDAAPAR